MGLKNLARKDAQARVKRATRTTKTPTAAMEALASNNDSPNERTVVISPPNEETAAFEIVGTAPFVQNRFSKKAGEIMMERQKKGSVANTKRTRQPKDFDALFRESMYSMPDGERGIPAAAFRKAMISACRLAQFKMTLAKLSVFIEADGYDKDDTTPLVKITHGEPEHYNAWARNETGVIDIRARAMWQPGWRAIVRVRYDADQFCLQDVTNLMMRVGKQVGVGEGRPDSPKSCGLGFGLFDTTTNGKGKQ